MANPHVLIPVKDLAAAKLRLAGVLDAGERSRLVLAMLADVLAATKDASLQATVLSPAATIRKFAEQCAAFAILEHPGATSLNEALGAVLDRWSDDANAVLILHGDTPLVTGAELRRMTALADELAAQAANTVGSMVIAPDRAESGTNALLLQHPTVIPLCFGPNSMAAHINAARARGVLHAVCRQPGIGLDLDTPDDLRAFMASDRQTETRRLLELLRVETRLARHHDGEGEKPARPCTP
jgi:2-phospho-L-lactate/phosphoenolpyruvate guanylyltransferase